MNRNIAVLFCVILCSTEILGTLDWIRLILEKVDRDVVRVRTPEERDRRSNEFAVLDFIGLVEQYEGYTAEEYDVLTDDGYILKLHRLSGSPYSPKAPGKPVIYLQHGLFGSSDFHVVLGPDQALTYQLADAGFDIWLGNVRGTTYSKRHIKYSSASSNKKFWKFSMDEMAIFDVPKFIDVVLEKTNQTKLTYIGYSMGTTLSYILLSTKPEYNDKMNLVVSIAPVAYFGFPHSALENSIILSEPVLKLAALAIRSYEILPQSKIIQIIGKDVCASEVGKIFCGSVLNSVVNLQNLNFTALPTILAYAPAGTSIFTLDHYYQMIFSGKFRKYNYGLLGNNLKTKKILPRKYDLTKITSPQAIFYSEDDVYVNEKDAIRLKNELQNVVVFEKTRSKYNHLDFIWANSVREIIYNRILNVVETYTISTNYIDDGSV